MKNLIAILLILLTTGLSMAQQQVADTLNIDGITIHATPARYAQYFTGNRISTITPRTIAQLPTASLADLLQQCSMANIQSLGFNGTSSINMRGTNSNHTAIVWNGFNIQNPLNGGFNVSLLPTQFIDEVDVQHGGSGAINGSGSIGGAIHLNNTPQYNKGLRITLAQHAGSFERYQTAATVAWSNKKYSGTIRLYQLQAANNFKYAPPGDTRRSMKQKSAAMLHRGLLTEHALRLTPRQILTARLWYTLSKRQLQPNMMATPRHEKQDDQQIRAALQYDYTLHQGKITLRSMVTADSLAYYNPILYGDKPSNSSSRSWISQAEAQHTIPWLPVGEHIITGGLFHQTDHGHANAFAKNKQLNRSAAFVHLKSMWLNKKIITRLNARQELSSLATAPLTWGVGTTLKINTLLTANASYNTTYRIPTFNDLFWIDGYAKGNPSLKPETGYTTEGGLTAKKTTSWGSLALSTTAYRSNIQQLIVWEQTTDGVWSPVNKPRVATLGLENQATAQYNHHKGYLRLNAGYDFTRSYNRDDPNKKQRNYIPQHQLRMRLTITHQQWLLFVSQTLAGERNIPNSYPDAMEAYAITDVGIRRTLQIKKYLLSANVTINNLFNKNYQIHYMYAMPGIYVLGGLTISYNK